MGKIMDTNRFAPDYAVSPGEIEEILENYALAHLMEENEDEEALYPDQARLYYQALEKTE